MRPLQLYNQELKRFEEVMGGGITYSKSLDEMGRREFPDRWKGIFMSNERYPLKGYSIVNTDKKNQPGEHWVAVADGMLYDSFGRKNIINNPTLTDVDSDAEQFTEEENCGQRCLAFLSVHYNLGPRAAFTI
jgi:hypothetical protein